MDEKATELIYAAFDLFKQYIAQNIKFDEWKKGLDKLWNTLQSESKKEEKDHLLCECILRMFYHGSIEIDRLRYEWKPAEIVVKFDGKEYKTELPIYDFGVFKYSPLSDHFYRSLIYTKLSEECTKVYDKFMPKAWL